MWNHHNERKVRTNFTALFLCPSNSSKITTTLKEMYEVVYAVSFKGFIAPLTYLLMAIETSFWWSMRKFSLLILSSLLYDTIVGHKIMVKLKFWLKIMEIMNRNLAILFFRLISDVKFLIYIDLNYQDSKPKDFYVLLKSRNYIWN